MIRVGTCSWIDKTLIRSGEFYPAEAKTAEGRLRHYSTHFDTVEVDATYYALPDIGTAALWAERTPANFTFHIKAYGALTGHGIDPATLPADLRERIPDQTAAPSMVYVKDPDLLGAISGRFRDALRPLKESGKLGLLVFQFPPWFTFSAQHLNHIIRCASLVTPLSVAVEFRHGSWLSPSNRERVLRFLSVHGLTYVTADEPQFGSLATVPFVPVSTTDIVYFRFHGRNRENWLKKGIPASLRYDYSYSDGELQGFAMNAASFHRQGRTVFLMFNNCHGASAVKNAIRIKDIVRQEPGIGR